MPAVPIDNPSDQETGDMQIDDEDSLERDYFFAKYNTELPGPQYTEEEYDAHLQHEEWTKDETDYLVNMVKEYYHRWAVVADRYEYVNEQQKQQEERLKNEMTTPTYRKPRLMEDLKARYYHIWAKSIELHTPGGVANMNPAEFHLHEILTKYDANHERRRKHLAEGLLARDPELVKEENILLAELQRINMQHSRLEAERADLRARLEAPQSTAPSEPLQSSAVLNQLYQQLFQAERTRKRGRLSVTTSDTLASPINHSAHPGSAPGSAATTGGGGTGAGGASGASHRDSLGAGGGSAGGHRKSSGAAGPTSATAAPVRSLSPAREARYGVSTPPDQRLSSGVLFRSDRIAKLRQGKSLAQTQKLSAALAALRIPDLIVLPTAKVCEAFERLVGRVTALNDMRRVVEKLEGEVRVAEAMKKPQEGSPQADGSGGGGGGGGDGNVDRDGDNDNAEDASNAVDENKTEGQTSVVDKATNDTVSGSGTVSKADSTNLKKENETEGESDVQDAEGLQLIGNGEVKATDTPTVTDNKTPQPSEQKHPQNTEGRETTDPEAEMEAAVRTPSAGPAPRDTSAAPDTAEPTGTNTTATESAATAPAGGEPASTSTPTPTPTPAQAPTAATATSTANASSTGAAVASPRPGSRSSGRGHKRSASVMSTASSNTTGAGTSGGTKRTRR